MIGIMSYWINIPLYSHSTEHQMNNQVISNFSCYNLWCLNILVCVFCWTNMCTSVELYIGVMGHKICMFGFSRYGQCCFVFSKMIIPTCPLLCRVWSSCAISTPTLDVDCHFYFSHSSECICTPLRFLMCVSLIISERNCFWLDVFAILN